MRTPARRESPAGRPRPAGRTQRSVVGPFLGVQATGRQVAVALLDLWRVADGLVVEQWGGPDVHDLLAQVRDDD